MLRKVLFCASLVASRLFNTQELLNNQALVMDAKEDATDDFLKISTRTSISALGKSVEWEVFTHKSFPRYSLRVKKDVKLCDTVEQIVGYLDVDDEKHFFFWFFESRSAPATDPLVLWLNGGPGCSSLTGLLMELGPCRAAPGGKNTTHNPSSWNNKANVIFLDQPVNVGFSYTEGKAPTNSDAAGEDTTAFLQLFLTSFKKYSALPFHVTGESYAGHYIPAIGRTILENNNNILPGMLSINLASLAIGNGLTDPLVQYQYYPDMACDEKYGPILPQETCDTMASKYGTCSSLIKACYNYKTPFACVPGSFYCNAAMIQPFQSTGLNIYDIRKKCDKSNPLCYDILNDIEAYLNQPSVQEKLGVDVVYEGCKKEINMNFLLAGDWMRPYVNYIGPILASGVKVLIYAGDADYICNHIGNKQWTLELEWPGKEEYNNAKDVKWTSKVTGRKAGEFRMHDNLAFLKVYEAGHMVPYDQPEHSLEFINMWIHGHTS